MILEESYLFYLAGLSWICFVALIAVLAHLFLGHWSHGAEGHVFMVLLATPILGGIGLLAGIPGALKRYPATWVAVVGNAVPVLFSLFIWWKLNT